MKRKSKGLPLVVWTFFFMALAGWAYVVFGDARALRSESARLRAEAQNLEIEQRAQVERQQADLAEMSEIERSETERLQGRPAHDRWARDILRVIEEFRATSRLTPTAKTKRPPPPPGGWMTCVFQSS